MMNVDLSNTQTHGALADVVVSIYRHDQLLGSGFLIDRLGTILTCDHVVRDPISQQVYENGVTARFAGKHHALDCIFQSPQPQLLDFAVLRLGDHCLPETARLLPLGKLHHERFPRDFLSYGFRASHLGENGLLAEGRLLGIREQDFGIKTWQLSSEAADRQQMRQGMSGAPILDVETHMIVGIFYEFSNENGGEIIPIALSLESIAEYWQATNGNREDSLETILAEQDLWHKLKETRLLEFGPQGWITERNFKDLYCTFPGLVEYRYLGNDPVGELLDQLRARGRVVEFIEHFKEKFPSVPVDERIQWQRAIRFVNREYEKRLACETTAPSYLFFEGPLGYGKTTLLREIAKEHIRKRWFCIHISASEELSSIQDLIRLIFHKMGIRANDLGESETEAANEAAGYIKRQIEDMNCIGLLITLDDAEKLPRGIIKPFFVFLRALFKRLSKPTGPGPVIDLRLRTAGAHSGALWRDEAGGIDPEGDYYVRTTLAVELLSPFQPKYVQEAVRHVLPTQADPAEYAAYMIYFSAGHPYCMAEILRRLGAAPSDVRAHFQGHLGIIHELIETTQANIRHTLEQNFAPLMPVLEKLCLFPIVDLRLLTILLHENYLPVAHDAYTLTEELSGTIYYNRDNKPPFLDDHVARRLLVAHLRLTNPAQYQASCEQVRDFYQAYLEHYSEFAEYVLLAALELELYLAEMRHPENAARMEEFFQPEGILEEYIQRLQTRWGGKAQHIFYQLTLLLRNPKIIWEFRFQINFLLSHPRVTEDTAFATFKARIEALVRPEALA